jgi:hypothetical protein
VAKKKQEKNVKTNIKQGKVEVTNYVGKDRKKRRIRGSERIKWRKSR